MMTTLGDGHCNVGPSQKFVTKVPLHELPFVMHKFSDGSFVVAAEPGNEEWIGRRITRLGSVPGWRCASADFGIRSKITFYPASWWRSVLLGYRGPLEALGCVDSNAQEMTIGFAARTRRNRKRGSGLFR